MKSRVAEVDTSSLPPKIYKQLTLSAMLLKLQHFSKLRKADFIKRAEVKIPESPVRDGSLFQPKLNVLDDESLLLDRLIEGGNLNYRLLKGLQMKYDMPLEKVKATAAIHAHNLAMVSLLFSVR